MKHKLQYYAKSNPAIFYCLNCKKDGLYPDFVYSMEKEIKIKGKKIVIGKDVLSECEQ